VIRMRVCASIPLSMLMSIFIGEVVIISLSGLVSVYTSGMSTGTVPNRATTSAAPHRAS
jgi:hypothetical protein